jgi:dihydroorotase
MVLLLKSAKIIDPGSPFHLQQKDLLIENGIICRIENQINSSADKVIDLKHLHVSQGWFDSSVSFGEPGFEDRETLKNGMDTAMKSGFTQIVLNPNTNPVLDNASLIQHIINKSSTHAVDVLPCGALTERSEGIHMAELYDMHSNAAVAFGDYKSSLKDSNLLKIAMQYSTSFKGLLQVFSVDHSLSQGCQVHEGTVSTTLGLKALPKMAEIIQLKRDLELVKYTGAKVHFTCISTLESVELIEKAKSDGLDVSCSVALSNLCFTDDVLKSFDAKYKVWPPLREKPDRDALIEGVKKGIIDMVTCDHQPLNIELKNVEFEHAEFGSIGLESAFGALNTIFDLETSIDVLTRGKSRFGLSASKIDVNEVANLSLFNPGIEWVFSEEDIFSKSKNAIFLNEDLKGKAYGIINKEQYHVSEE